MSSNNISNEVLAERVRVVERDIKGIKTALKEQELELDALPLILHRLGNIEKSVEAMSSTISKDSGWRGFFIDFIKAAAQICALVGAGKFIF